MPELNPHIQSFNTHFDVFDTAAHGGSPDDKVARADIEAVANGAQYTPEQRSAAQYLLDNPDQYALLDTGRDGGGLYQADGTISRQDLNSIVEQSPPFADTAAFVSDSPVIPENQDPDFETPAGAAAQTELVRTSSMSGGTESATSQFQNFIAEHQDDPAWLADYFAALGAENTAEYLAYMSNPTRYDQNSSEFAQESVAAAQTALQTMYENGSLNDADIARMVEQWAMAGGDFSSGIAQLFGGMQGPRAQDMQNAFFRATTELAMSGQDLGNREFTFSGDVNDRLTDGDRESLAAAGAYVLAQTGTENQVSRLIDLQNDGGEDFNAIDRFITLAMANPTETFQIDALTHEGSQARIEDPTAGLVRYDGVAQLVTSLSVDSTYRGGPDASLPPPPYSYAALQSVRDEVFYSAANGLDANRNEWQDNTELKDGLARIFTTDFDQMMNDAASPNDARFDDEHPFPEALENFAQNVLFTDPTGALRDSTSEFLVDKLSETINDVNTMNDQEFMEKYGRNQAQMTHMTGSILGHVNNGLEQAMEVASDKHEAQKNGLEFGLDLAWALGQDGLKLLPGGNVLSAVLPDSITQSAAYGEIKGELESYLQNGALDQAASLLLDKFPDLHADAVLTGLNQELSEVVSVGNERDYLSALLSSYENVDSNPAAQ